MPYTVIRDFIDLQDSQYRYHVGDSFPRDGVELDNARAKELCAPSGRRTYALLKEIAAPKPKKSKKVESIELDNDIVDLTGHDL